MVDLNYLKRLQIPSGLANENLLLEENFKFLSTPQSVLLNCTNWKNPFLFRGSIQLLNEGQLTLQWSTTIHTDQDQISLHSLTREQVLVGKDSYLYSKNQLKSIKGIEENNSIVLGTTSTLIIVFTDDQICQKWSNSLFRCLSRLSYEDYSESRSEYGQQSLRSENFGAIYDIEETGNTNEMWKEIKITFIKEDSSHFEYLNYDKTQEDLSESLKEVISSVEDSVDLVNRKILESYLKTIEVQEKVRRVENVEGFLLTRQLTPTSISFSRKSNSSLRDEYCLLDGNEMIREMMVMIKEYKTHKGTDVVSESFQLLYMQKLALSAEMHQLACEYQLNSLKKKLNLDDNGEVKKTEGDESPAGKKEEEDWAKKQALKAEKSCLRGACECVVC